jgi:Xaa-Pro aminopeptidase
MRKARNLERVEAYWDYPAAPGEGWPERLQALLDDLSVVGIESSAKMEIAAALAGREVRALPLVEELRLVKSADEIAAIRRASSYADFGMRLMCANLYRGVTPLEMFSLARKIQTRIVVDREFDPLASEILTACWPAPASAKPHGVPELGDRALSGPIQNMSFLRVNGYAAECERTVFVEKPSKDSRDLFRRVLEARDLVFKSLKPGASCSDVDAAAKAYFRDRGLDGYLLHRSGHGIGLSNHEGPYLSEGSNDLLRANMVVSVEPALYLPELGGFRHSDTVLITESGCESLTAFPTAIKDLVFAGLRPLKRLKGGIIRAALKM